MRRLAPLLALAALAGCGSTTKPADIPSGTASSSPPPAETTTTTATQTTPQASAKGNSVDVRVSPTKDLAKKPRIPKQPGDPPSQLVVQDIVKGKGAVAQDGDTLTVRYVGVRFRDNQQFDASWERKPNSFKFPLGQGQVIPGWDQGIKGMRVGGRRQLTIPPDLGYGAQGSPPDIAPNETLVFVVDLLKVSKS